MFVIINYNVDVEGMFPKYSDISSVFDHVNIFLTVNNLTTKLSLQIM